MCKIYGIDLGTTNSLIGCDNKLISGLVSSRVDLNTGEVVMHSDVREGTYGSYKVNMTTGREGELPIKASSYVLQTLCNIVKTKTGNTVKDVVISVPAYFASSQREAVKKAAESVGLNVVAIINEPTAAAIHVCRTSDISIINRDIYAVYDLGGGTFDCTLIDSRSGKYSVIGTTGIFIGGDDLDKAIVEYVLDKRKIPQYKRTKQYMAVCLVEAEKWKRNMQKAYNMVYSDDYIGVFHLEDEDIHITLKEYKKLVDDTFLKTAYIIKGLIRDKLPSGASYKLVFVGGSTKDTYLCEQVMKVLGLTLKDIVLDEDPYWSVALGAVEYATYLQEGHEDILFNDVTRQISIADKDGKSIVVIPNNSRIPISRKRLVSNTSKTDILYLNIYQGESIMCKDNEYIGTMEYMYPNIMEADEGEVEVTLSVDSSGYVKVEVEDIVNFGEKQECEIRMY